MRLLEASTEWTRFERSGTAVHSFLEGPAFDRNGVLYCVDIAHGRVFRVGADGGWTVVRQYDSVPTGLKIHADGRLFIADNKLGILEMDPLSGTITPFVTRHNLEPLRGCNDLIFARNGDLYFTAPGQSSLANRCGRLYCATPEGRTTLLLDGIPYPNGLAFNLDDTELFLSVTYANAIWRVPLDSAAEPPPVGLHIQLSGGLGPDGLALDADGNLAVAYARHGTVWLFNDLGEPIARIRSCAGRSVTNLAYGGVGNRTIFITEAATGSILAADVSVPGKAMFSHA
jgi:gluconolactonase